MKAKLASLGLLVAMIGSGAAVESRAAGLALGSRLFAPESYVDSAQPAGTPDTVTANGNDCVSVDGHIYCRVTNAPVIYQSEDGAGSPQIPAGIPLSYR